MEENMGRQRVVNKAITPQQILQALQAGSITIAQAQQMFNGVMPIGDYKGIAAIFDLDLLVNQPLVQAERLYALDKLDARDIVTAAVPIGTLLAAVIRARSTAVPVGEVWYINRATINIPAQTGAEGIVQANFRISSWAIPDVRAGLVADADGRAYWPADLGTAAVDAFVVDFPAQGELGEELRLVAGDVITLVATVTTANIATVAKDTTLTFWGRKGKLLVA